MDDICDLAKKVINLGDHGHVFLPALTFPSHWRKIQSLLKEKEVANHGGGEQIAIKEKEVLEV